jgi:D-alanyl-lipoteichoic acid acyltransferase DltB (MBOAT superfamily)
VARGVADLVVVAAIVAVLTVPVYWLGSRARPRLTVVVLLFSFAEVMMFLVVTSSARDAESLAEVAVVAAAASLVVLLVEVALAVGWRLRRLLESWRDARRASARVPVARARGARWTRDRVAHSRRYG